MLGDDLEPRYAGVRVFLTAARRRLRRDARRADPRSPPSADSMVVSMQRGGGSKDTWVLADEPGQHLQPPAPGPRPVELSRAGGDLRAAPPTTSTGWAATSSAPRAWSACCAAILVRLTEQSGMAEVPELPVAAAGARPRRPETFPGFLDHSRPDSSSEPEGELLSVIFDRERPGSLAATLVLLQRVAAKVRDRISLDMWRTLSHLMVDLMADLDRDGQGPGDGRRAAPSSTGSTPAASSATSLELLDAGISRLAAFSGLVAENMTRGPVAGRFLDMGRRLERSLQIVQPAPRHPRSRQPRRGPAAGGPARDRRQHHDLPPPLPEHAPDGAGARPARWPTRPTRGRWPSSSPPWPRASTACPATPRCPGRSAEQRWSSPT